jgi:hypothetical protein
MTFPQRLIGIAASMVFLLGLLWPSTEITHNCTVHYMDIWGDAAGDALIISILAVACLLTAATGSKNGFKWSAIACLSFAALSFATEVRGFGDSTGTAVSYAPYWGWVLFPGGGLLCLLATWLFNRRPNQVMQTDVGFADIADHQSR